MSQAELEEFLEASSLASRNHGRSRSSDDPPAEFSSCTDVEAELHELALVGKVVQKKRFEHRSLESVQHARNALQAKRAREQLECERQKRKKAELVLAVIATDPSCTAVAGMRTRKIPKEVLPMLWMKLAAMPRLRTSMLSKHRKRQTRALAIVATVVREQRNRCWQRLVGQSAISDFTESGVAAGTVLMFCCQWDETSQKFLSQRKLVVGEKAATGQLSSQVMVMSGTMASCGIASSGLSSEPFFMNTVVVAETSANFLLEAILRACPIDLESVEALSMLSSRAEFVSMAITVDRAASNIKCANWIAWVCENHPTPSVLPWCEFCGAHGVALVKSRAHRMKQVCGALCSLTHWVRQDRSVSMLRSTIRKIISRTLVVRFHSCPEAFFSGGVELIKALYGGEASLALLRWDSRKHCYVETPLMRNLLDLCTVSTLGGLGAPWCIIVASTRQMQLAAEQVPRAAHRSKSLSTK